MKLLLLIPFFTFAQIKVNDRITIPDGALHFYSEVLISESTYRIQTLLFPKQKHEWKLFNTWLVGQAVAFGKEIFDKYKRNPTGFSWEDIANDELGIHSWLMWKIAITDYRRNKYEYSFSSKHLLD